MRINIILFSILISGCFNPDGTVPPIFTDSSMMTLTSGMSNPVSSDFTTMEDPSDGSATEIMGSSGFPSSDSFVTTDITSTGINLDMGLISTTTLTSGTTFETTTEITSTTAPLTTGNMETCGDCILQSDEECDPCLYINTEQSMCRSMAVDQWPKCTLQFLEKPMLHVSNISGMQDTMFNQEEANLLCQIITGQNTTAEAYNFGIGFPSKYGFIFTSANYSYNPILLKNVMQFFNSDQLYYSDWKDIKNNMGLDQTFYNTGDCQL